MITILNKNWNSKKITENVDKYVQLYKCLDNSSISRDFLFSASIKGLLLLMFLNWCIKKLFLDE